MMKMCKTLLALVLCLALALPCALAEEAYTPGETMMALFAEAWNNRQMITADLSVQLELNGETLGLSDEDMAQLNTLSSLLDVSTLRMGVCRIEGGVRLLLAGIVKAQEGAQDVYADAAVDVTRAGLSIDSSLLEGRRVSVTWETLLSLAGLSDEEIAMAMGALDADWEAILAEVLTQAEPYVEMAMQILAPYGETVAAWAQTLTIEQLDDVEATEDYPAVATLIDVYITEKDLGALITSLSTQLEADSTLCAILDSLIEEVYDGEAPAPTTAQVCEEMREAAEGLTDEEYPLILTLAMDEDGMPLYAEFYNSVADGTAQYAGVFLYPDAADPALYNYELSAFGIDIDGNATNGFMIYGTCKSDEADPLRCDLTMDMAIVLDREYVMGLSYVMNTAGMTTAEGLPGMTNSAELTMSVEDGDDSVALIMNMQTATSLTALGGEQSDVQETVDLYVGDESVSVGVLGTMIVEPGENGLTGSYSILETMPGVGIDRYGMQMILASADYTPAELTEIALETASEETMNTISEDVYTAAMQLLEQLTQALPADVLEMVGDIANAM